MNERFLKRVPRYACAVRYTFLKKKVLSDQVSLGKTVVFIYMMENPINAHPLLIVVDFRKSEDREPV